MTKADCARLVAASRTVLRDQLKTHDPRQQNRHRP